MGESPLALTGLRALGDAGPFAVDDQPGWFTLDGVVRDLDLDAYGRAVEDTGATRPQAEDLVARMRGAGIDRVVWFGAQGGRRGHVRSSWDVRIAVGTEPAVDAVPRITALGGLPLGATALAVEDPVRAATSVVVLQAYTMPVEPEVRRFPASTGGRWARTFRVPQQLTDHATSMGYAALACGPVGATVLVRTTSAEVTRSALRRLVHVTATDLRDAGPRP